MGNYKKIMKTPGSVLNPEFDEEEPLDGFERLCFIDHPSGRQGDDRVMSTTTSARRKARTTKDDEAETRFLPDEEPEGWALP